MANITMGLRGAYLILAARLIGLDRGPMSGFDPLRVDGMFFAGTPIKPNFICSLGHVTSEALFPRLPRFEFDQIARFA